MGIVTLKPKPATVIPIIMEKAVRYYASMEHLRMEIVIVPKVTKALPVRLKSGVVIWVGGVANNGPILK